MRCPFCLVQDTKVVDSRDVNDARNIRRRRECGECKRRFTTYEEMESLKLTVIKRDNSKEEYDTKKVRVGIEKSLEKRPVSTDEIDKIMSEVEYALHAKHAKEIKSRDIGKMVMKKLKEIDEVGYIRFASVYKSFGSASSFKKEIDRLNNPDHKNNN